MRNFCGSPVEDSSSAVAASNSAPPAAAYSSGANSVECPPGTALSSAAYSSEPSTADTCAVQASPTSEGDEYFSGGGDCPPADVLSSSSFAARPSKAEEKAALKRVPGFLDEAAYTADAKGLRYMSLAAIIKVTVGHLLSNFYSANVTPAAEVEGAASGNGYSSKYTDVEVREPLHHQVSSNGFFSLQDYCGQLVSHVLHRQDAAPTAHAVPQEAQGPAVTRECGNFSSNLAKRRQSELRCHNVGAEGPSVVLFHSCHSSLEKLCAGRGEADGTNCASPSGTPQEVFAGVISVEKLAMLDAGVYIRPDLSEILSSRQQANEVQAMLKRCRDIDAKVCELKKRVYVRWPSSGTHSQRRKLRGDDGTASSGGDGQEVAEVMSNKGRAESETKVVSADSGTAVGSTPSASVFHNVQRTGRFRSPTDAFYAVAASAEILALRREKLQLRRRLADVRALVEYVWKYGGFSRTSQINADQFSQLFCSNMENVSQQRAAAVLFELCDAGHRGSVTLEDLFTRLPLRALEVMFIVTEMERKARQAYRYYWI